MGNVPADKEPALLVRDPGGDLLLAPGHEAVHPGRGIGLADKHPVRPLPQDFPGVFQEVISVSAQAVADQRRDFPEHLALVELVVPHVRNVPAGTEDAHPGEQGQGKLGHGLIDVNEHLVLPVQESLDQFVDPVRLGDQGGEGPGGYPPADLAPRFRTGFLGHWVDGQDVPVRVGVQDVGKESRRVARKSWTGFRGRTDSGSRT